MFKRFSDSLRSMLISDSDDQIEALKALGFDAARARQALEATNGNISSAAEILLHEQDDAPSTRTVRRDKTFIVHGDTTSGARTLAGKAAMDRAQRRVGTHGHSNPSARTSRPSQRTTSSSKATDIHHDLSLPTPITALTKEEQILRCAQRLAPHALAVDSLIKLFQNIRQNPHVDTYRTLYTSHPEYQRVIQDKPGAQDLLHAVHFYSTTHKESGALILPRSMVDSALLFLAVSALENIRENSQEYKTGKAMLAFAKEIDSVLSLADSSQDEAIQRATFLAKCPTESYDSGVLLQIHLGPHHTISRRFDADDTLRDVLHWLGAHSSTIPHKLSSREWCLVNLNSFPVEPMDAVQDVDRTLQYLGCFPSARLEIRPTLPS